MKKQSHLADNDHMAGNDWRKREGIEPSEDISASRPDLKSGGATSAPSASVVREPIPRRGKGFTSASSLPWRAVSSTCPSGAGAAGFPVYVRSSCEPPRKSLDTGADIIAKGREER